MDILAITDIPRMTALFEQLALQYPELTVVSEIHRGIEELENRKPSVVIFQNRLSGLSADILHKHLKSRLGQRKVRFALISTAENLDVEISARFDAILDPVQTDEQLKQALHNLLDPSKTKPRREDTLLLQSLVTAASPTEQEEEEPVPEPAPPTPPPAELSSTPVSTSLQELQAEPAENPAAPATYELPRRSSTLSIISDFSKQLDTSTERLEPEPEPFAHREQELSLKDLHRVPHLITDTDEPLPWYRKPPVVLTGVTLLVVLAVSLVQYRSNRHPSQKRTETAVATKTPALPVAQNAAQKTVTSASNESRQLVSHGEGRPRALPAFIPREGHDANYGKEHAGWELYQGQTSEYRVFRQKDGGIKAIQVIDRSGAGIQEPFYTSILKELAGVTAMRPTSSEIKEGYEIRRGEAAGLDIVQYRDAQGGRMRGFVVTWP